MKLFKNIVGHTIKWALTNIGPADADRTANFVAGGIFVIFCADKGRLPESPQELDKYADQFYPLN